MKILFYILGLLLIIDKIEASHKVITTDEIIRIKVSTDSKKPYDLETSGFAHATFYNAILGKLLNVTKSGSITPNLLSEAYWDFNENHYVLTIRNDLKFHNGREVTSEDIDFSFTRFFLTNKRCDPIIFLNNIKGITDLKRGDSYTPWAVTGIKRLSSKSVAIKLNTINPFFLYGLNEGWISLVPREALNKDLVTWKKTPIGSGEFKVIKDEPLSPYVLLQNIKNKNLYAQFSSSPEKEMIDIASFMKENPDPENLDEVIEIIPSGFTGIFFNYNNPLAHDINFRLFLNHALDRDSLIAGYNQLQTQVQLLTSNFIGRIIDPECHNKEKARYYLNKFADKLPKSPLIVYSKQKGGKLTKFEKIFYKRLKSQLEFFGLQIKYKETESITFSKDDNESIFRIGDRGSTFVDPLVFFSAFDTDGFLSCFIPKYEQEFNKTLSLAKNSRGVEERAHFARKISIFFLKKAYIIPIYERKKVFYINKRKISQIGDQMDLSFNLAEVGIIK